MPNINVNSTTGIRFGVIPANRVPGLVETIYERGVDVDYRQYRAEMLADIKRLLEVGNNYDLLNFIQQVTNHSSSEADTLAAGYLKEQGGEPVSDADAQAIYDDLSLSDHYLNDEPVYEFTDRRGNHFSLSNHHVWCIETCLVVFCKSMCTACYPNTGDLSSGLTSEDEGHECYGIPSYYLEDEENR